MVFHRIINIIFSFFKKLYNFFISFFLILKKKKVFVIILIACIIVFRFNNIFSFHFSWLFLSLVVVILSFFFFLYQTRILSFFKNNDFFQIIFFYFLFFKNKIYKYIFIFLQINFSFFEKIFLFFCMFFIFTAFLICLTKFTFFLNIFILFCSFFFLILRLFNMLENEVCSKFLKNENINFSNIQKKVGFSNNIFIEKKINIYKNFYFIHKRYFINSEKKTLVLKGIKNALTSSGAAGLLASLAVIFENDRQQSKNRESRERQNDSVLKSQERLEQMKIDNQNMEDNKNMKKHLLITII